MTVHELQLSGNSDKDIVEMTPDTQQRLLLLITGHLQDNQHPISRLIKQFQDRFFGESVLLFKQASLQNEVLFEKHFQAAKSL